MKVLIIDTEKCTGCNSCQVVCSAWNTDSVNLEHSCIRLIPFEKEMFYFPNVCAQCSMAYCELSCPINAISRNKETGALEVNKEKCVGCKTCLLACPLGAISIVDGTSHKCNLCEGDPKCVASCEYGAITFGEVEEIGSNKRIMIAESIKETLLSTPVTSHKIKVGTVGTKAGVIKAKDLGLEEADRDD